MQGTEKQVAWASEIKAQKIQDLNKQMNAALEGGAEPSATKEMLQKCIALLDEFHASVLIEHRNYDVTDLLDAVASRTLGKTAWDN